MQSYFSDTICDGCYIEQIIPVTCSDTGSCKMQVALPPIKQGWQASFLELYYNVDHNRFIVTTECNVTPDVMPLSFTDREL